MGGTLYSVRRLAAVDPLAECAVTVASVLTDTRADEASYEREIDAVLDAYEQRHHVRLSVAARQVFHEAEFRRMTDELNPALGNAGWRGVAQQLLSENRDLRLEVLVLRGNARFGKPTKTSGARDSIDGT